MSDNPNLKRVALNLSQAIVVFWMSREGTLNKEFTATELRQYVQRHSFGTAPSSADRVMRQLRQQKKINYILVNRAKSLYWALPL